MEGVKSDMLKVSKLKIRLEYILSFLLPVLILAVNFIIVGKHYILNADDVVPQYIPFLNFLKRLTFFDESIIKRIWSD